MTMINRLRSLLDLATKTEAADDLASLRLLLREVKTRALEISEANNDRANMLENRKARIEEEIARLDAESDEADLIAVAAARILGED